MLYPTRSKIKPCLILSLLLSVSLFGYLHFARENAAQMRDSDAAVLQEFSAWARAYTEAPRASEAARGRALAERRKQMLGRMIGSDPQRVIENSIDEEVFARMPADIAQHIERQVSFVGSFEVYIADLIDPVTGEPAGSRTDRFVVIGGERFPAVVYGRREGMTTKHNIPMRGVRIGDKVVLDEAPAKMLTTAGPGEKITVDVGGERREFSSEFELQSFINEQVEWESKIGPDRGDSNRPDSTWTEGAKKTLVIMADFSDMPGVPKNTQGVPYTEAQLRQVFSQTVTPFYTDNSYGKTSLTLEAVTPVLRLPQTIAFYSAGTNYTVMLADARAAARAAGFETNNYDLDMVLFSRTPLYPWSGLAHGGAKGSYINGAFDFRVVSHELGHNYGLPHANRWQTSDGSVIGTGSMVEYGDVYDSMGTGGNHTTQCHFNAYYKHKLDWLTATDVKVATENGTYRIFPHDIPTATGVRALKIPRNAISDYWVEFRQMFPNSPATMNGATVRWETLGSAGSMRTSHLLDATPLTPNTVHDHALQVGQSITDDQNRIKITIVGKGGTTPESLDVKVETNIGCTFDNVTAAGTSFAASGGEGTVTAATQPGCRMTPTSSVDWIVPAMGIGGSAGYVVAANYGSQPRTGTLTFNGQTITVLQAGAVTQCVPRPAGIVAWWRGEGNIQEQINGLAANSMGGGYSAGKVGAGISNNITVPAGAMAVRVIESPVVALSRSMTIEGWIKVNAHGFSQRVIVTEQPSYDVQIDAEGILYFGTWRVSPIGVYTGAAVGSDPLPTGQFVHFAGTLDDATGEFRMYINGQFVRQIVSTERPMAHPAVALHLARMNGVADEISIYNRALAASEISAIYSAGTAATGAAGKCLTAAAPTASVSGRVLSPSGQALRNVAVTLVDAAGVRRTATTSSFGVYTFTNVATGSDHTLTASSRRYRFNPRILNLSENLTNIDLLGQE